ncbi:hypothetical protein RHMOL_Rhmol01G0108200 [Rhododendron molle]|uniref:Uncharacterized protein n=1 Tax=Rhododendron molle TaxID=49168 RepID=A0ACC0Q1I4_RHOML|nr:hypothetical protein RHMOL_Rhmol01G0108200 [Rhododendron molle]
MRGFFFSKVVSISRHDSMFTVCVALSMDPSFLPPPKLVIFEGMGSPSDLVEYTYETLDSITGGFSAENKIGSTKYGELFRGEIDQGMETQEVLVKIFVHPSSVGKCPRFSARPDLRQSR